MKIEHLALLRYVKVQKCTHDVGIADRRFRLDFWLASDVVVIDKGRSEQWSDPTSDAKSRILPSLRTTLRLQFNL